MSQSVPYGGLPQLLVVAALGLTLVAAAGCGGSDATRDRTTPTEPGHTSGGNDDTEAVVSTELDLGQAFAEDPRFEGELGPTSIVITTDRTNLQQPEIDIELTPSGTTALGDVSFKLRLEVLEGELMPASDHDLVLSVDQTQGDCTELEETAFVFALRCDLDAIEPAGKAGIHIVVSGMFKLATTVGIATR